jgi:hypothetical protein
MHVMHDTSYDTPIMSSLIYLRVPATRYAKCIYKQIIREPIGHHSLNQSTLSLAFLQTEQAKLYNMVNPGSIFLRWGSILVQCSL